MTVTTQQTDKYGIFAGPSFVKFPGLVEILKQHKNISINCINNY